MIVPIIPILAWTGGIVVGAKVAGGAVRGAGELLRGRPRAALVHVAGAVVSPVCLVYEQLRDLGRDVRIAVLGHPQQPATSLPASPLASRRSARRPRRRPAQPHSLAAATVNGKPSAAPEG